MGGTTQIKTTVSCGSATSPGLDINPEEGSMVLRFSVAIGSGAVENIDVPLVAGDTGESISAKVSAQAEQSSAGSSTTVSKPNRVEKSQRKDGEIVVTVDDEFTVTFAGASHVDAGSNCQGKVRFEGNNYNSGGGGVMVDPPGPLPPRPPPLPPMNPGNWPKWKSWLKPDPGIQKIRPDRKYVMIPEHWKKMFQSPAPPDPPTWPPLPPNDPRGPFDGPRPAGLGILVIGAEAEIVHGVSTRDTLQVPFMHVYESCDAQMWEMFERLNDAGVQCVLSGGALIPVCMPDGVRPVHLLGFIESVDSLPTDRPFPWHWTLLPEAGRRLGDLQSDAGVAGRSTRALISSADGELARSMPDVFVKMPGNSTIRYLPTPLESAVKQPASAGSMEGLRSEVDDR